VKFPEFRDSVRQGNEITHHSSDYNQFEMSGVHWHESSTLWRKEKHKLSALERKSESLRRWKFQQTI
jgi:hypothetical protein